MRARQWESRGVVIERCARPSCRTVAGVARCREAYLRVDRVIGVVVIRLVARDAGGIRAGQTVVAVHMALRALQAGMRAAQRETGRRVTKRRTRPTGGRVALIAGLRKPSLYVVRIRRALEILQVALGTGATGQAVVIAYVALSTLQRSVRTRQCEASGRVIEGRRRPIRRAMARLTRLRESSRRVWRIVSAVEIDQVAADASRISAGQVVIAIHVALSALQ